MNLLADYVTQSTRFSRKPNGPPVLAQIDELDEPEAQACCAEMQNLLDYANYLFEMARDPEEYDALVLDETHQEVRREIAEHRCYPPISQALLEAVKGSWMFDAFKNGLDQYDGEYKDWTQIQVLP